MMLTFLEYAWSAFFIGLLCCCAIVVMYFPVALFFRVIQFWKPSFGRRYITPEPERERVQVSPHAAKKIALDFIFEESMRRRKVNVKQEHEYLAQPVIKKDAVEFSLEELRQVVAQPPRKVPAQQTDLWCILRYKEKIPYYLCSKLSTRDGLKTGWSPSPKKRLTMDKESAARWCQQLGPECFFGPGNAEARILLREVMKHMTGEEQRVEQTA